MTTESDRKSRARRAGLAALFFCDLRGCDDAFRSMAHRRASASFSDVRKALRWSAKHRPPAAVIDADSVGSDGPTLVRSLRSRGYDDPVFVVSSDLDRTRAAYDALEVRHYIRKPIDAPVVEQQIESAVAAHQALTILRQGAAPGGSRSAAKHSTSGRRLATAAVIVLALLGAVWFALRGHTGGLAAPASSPGSSPSSQSVARTSSVSATETGAPASQPTSAANSQSNAGGSVATAARTAQKLSATHNQSSTDDASLDSRQIANAGAAPSRASGGRQAPGISKVGAGSSGAGSGSGATGGSGQPAPAGARPAPPGSPVAHPGLGVNTGGGPPADASLVVMNGDGSVLFSSNGDTARTPASAVKLIVAAAALRDLGPNFRFTTELGSRQPPVGGKLSGGLIVRGTGDPTFITSDLAKGIRALHDAGVHAVHGVYVEARPFTSPERNPAWPASDLRQPYAAGVSAVALDGDLDAGIPVQNIPQFVAHRVAGELRDEGIDVTGPIGAVNSAQLKWVGWRHQSEKLDDIVREMLARSDNFYAEQLLRAIGARATGSGSIEAGIHAEVAVLRQLSVPLDGVRLVDASGLAESNRISAMQLATLLDREERSPLGNVFYRTLPTMASGHPSRNGVKTADARVKDGHLSDVSALAGYVNSRDRGRLAFAYIVNQTNLSHSDFQRVQRRIVAQLAQF